MYGTRIEEGKINNSELISVDLITDISKSICKIKTKNKTGSGFLIKLFKGNNIFFCLMTNEHIVTKEMIRKKDIISFDYNQEKNKKEIILNHEHRYIKEFKDMNIDATVIEILPQDNIDKNYFLLPFTDYIYDINMLKESEIMIIQYPKNKLYCSFGKIKNINGNEIIHLASTDAGSSGSPIFLKDSNKVIGIHKGGNSNCSENYGDLIGPIFFYFVRFNQSNMELNKVNINNGELLNERINGIINYNTGNIIYSGDYYNSLGNNILTL